MRKNLFAIMALLACAFVACNKNEIEITTEPAGTVEMTVVAGEANTKTAFNGAETGIIWSGTEKLRVIEKVSGGTDDGKYFDKVSSAGTTSDAGATMDFNVTMDTHASATGFQYIALYPSSSFQKVTNFTNIAVNTLDAQNPTASSFDPAADMLISQVTSESATQPTSINMAFARKVAIGKMTIKNLGSSEDITSVAFSAKQGASDVVLAGRSKVDFSTSTVDYGSNIQSKTLTLDYSGDGIKLNTAEGAPIYFVSYPFLLNVTNEGQFTVVVETETKRFTRTVTLTGEQTLQLKAGDVSRFSVNMSGVAGVSKAVSLHYAELTKDDVYGAGITSVTYSPLNLQKTHNDIWLGKVSYANGGFGIRNSAGTNDSYVQLPTFAEEISTITLELSQAIADNAEPGKTPYLSLETASDINTKSIASLDRVADQMTYVFDVSSNHINTAYLRVTNNPVYISKLIITTSKVDTRSALTTPASVTAARNTDDDDVTNSIDVSWGSVSGAIEYQVTLTPEVGEPVVQTTTGTSYTFTGLAYSTSYTPSVIAIADPYVALNSLSGTGEAAATIAQPHIITLTAETITPAASNSYGNLQSITEGGYTWKHTGNVTSAGAFVQLSNNGSYIEIPVVPGTIDRIVFAVTSASGTTINDAGNKCKNNLTFTCISGSTSSSVDSGTGTNSITLTPTASTYRNGIITASGALRIWSIKVYYTADDATLSSITITTAATKTTYGIGEAIAFDGKVRGNYSNSSIADVTRYVSATGDTSSAGAKTVTVSYGGKFTTYDITVSSTKTVTYTVTSKTAVSASGSTPAGSAATYSQTYSTAKQMTNGNSITLTLTGYDSKTIKGATVRVKSNASSGAGSLSLVTGTDSIASIADSGFNTANWNGSYSSSYVDKELTITERTIGSGKSIILTISASANSLFFESLTLSYED